MPIPPIMGEFRPHDLDWKSRAESLWTELVYQCHRDIRSLEQWDAKFIDAGFPPYDWKVQFGPIGVHEVGYLTEDGRPRYVVRLRRNTSRKQLCKALGIRITGWMLDFNNGEPYADRPMIVWFYEP